MTHLTRAAVVAVLLLAAACGDAESSEQQVVDEWCDALVDMSEAGKIFLEDPDEATPEQQERAVTEGERFFATEPPPEVADAVAVVRDGPTDGDPMATQNATEEMRLYAQDACDGLDPELL